MLRESSFNKEWPIVPLSDAVDFLDNLRKPVKASDRIDGEYLYYGANGLQGTIKDYIFDEPLVLLAEDGGHFGNPDRDIAYIADGKYWVNNHAHVLKPKAGVDLDFLYRVLQRYDVRSFIKGATRAKLTKGDASRIPFPLPPLKEQKRIAAILDKADNLRRKRQQAIRLADEFLRAVFLDMFGDPVTNPKGWEVKTFNECLANGSVLEVQDGNHGNDHPKVADFKNSGYPFVAANVVRKGKILFDKCYYLDEYWLNKLRIGFAKPGDVLLSHKGSLGFTAVLDESYETYVFSPQTTYYRLNTAEIEPEFLKGYFDSTYFQRMFQKEGIQSTRAYLGITRQKELPVMLPPIERQREFVSIVKKYNEKEKLLGDSDNHGALLFESLSQQAFSGQLSA